MPQGNRQTPTIVTIEYEEYAKNNVGGYTVYTFYVKGSNSFIFDLPLPSQFIIRLAVILCFVYSSSE